jgi:hypothetical protein
MFNCGCPSPSVCLETLTEGQPFPYCAQPCQTNVDCPGGFYCSQVVSLCCDPAQTGNCASFEGQTCNAGAGGVGICHGFQVLDESTLKYLCADQKTLVPLILESDCSPVTGFCQ